MKSIEDVLKNLMTHAYKVQGIGSCADCSYDPRYTCTLDMAKDAADVIKSLQAKIEDESPTPVHDAVNHPSHYIQGGIECIDAIEAATEGLSGFEGMCTGNAIKYMWRWKYKNGVQDIEKAIWYLTRLKDYLTKKGEKSSG